MQSVIVKNQNLSNSKINSGLLSKLRIKYQSKEKTCIHKWFIKTMTCLIWNMDSNTNFPNTTIEFLSTKTFEESFYQTRLQTSKLKKKC